MMARDFVFTLRERLQQKLEAITGIGLVYDHSLYLEGMPDLHSLLKSTIDGVPQVRFWIIDVPELSTAQLATQMQSEVPKAVIYGYIGLSTKPGGAPTTSGTATGGGATTLTDSAKAWTVNAYADKYTVWLTGGTGSGQYRHVAANTATQLTVTRAWATNPAAGTTYEVWPQPSELTLWALAYAVLAALSADRSLTNLTGAVSGLPQVKMDVVRFMDTILCNRVTIELGRGRDQARTYV